MLLLLFSHYVQVCSAAAKSLQSCPTLCDPMDGSPWGCPIPGILQQEHWSGLPFLSPMHESEKWKWKWSRVWLLATPWTAAHQAPPSMGFSRQECWSGVPLCPTLCDPMDCSLPGSSVHGILQARILKWIAISFSRVPSGPRDQTFVSCTGRWILYHWATWGALSIYLHIDMYNWITMLHTWN